MFRVHRRGCTSHFDRSTGNGGESVARWSFLALPKLGIRFSYPDVAMLRTLTPPEPELLRLCHLQTWGAVSGRSQSHPREAQPSEAALRGEGSTALAAAVRSGAPTTVLDALLHANEHQIALTHRQRGSVLHEALQYRRDDDVLDFLLTALVKYQGRSENTHLHSVHSLPTESQFRHVDVQEQRLLVFSPLLGALDGMKRTALHLVVERIKRLWTSAPRLVEPDLSFLQKLLHAHPEAVRTTDVDGNTPLMVLLLTPRCAPVGRVERGIARIVRDMLDASPGAATVAQSAPRPWRSNHSLPTHQRRPSYGGQSAAFGAVAGVSPAVVGPLPLYYAVLHGRSLETLHLLLRDHRRAELCGSATVVTPYREVPLHVAVTTRAPLGVLHLLLQDCPEAVLARDAYQLNAVDWLWIRHVVDCHGNRLDALSSRIVSRRRCVPTHFLDWHDELTRSCTPNRTQPTTAVDNPIMRSNLQDELLQRLQLLLPIAASVSLGDGLPPEPPRHWSFLHAACCVPCPLAVVRWALQLDCAPGHNGNPSVRTKDDRYGRLPIHFAVSRTGYVANVPVGPVSTPVQVIREGSAAVEVAKAYPESCRVRDCRDQLPLHVCIDAYKGTASCDLDHTLERENEHLQILETLISCYPDSLDQRDGATNLYPWQQAAVGNDTSLNAIFLLLRASGTARFNVL